MTFDQLLLSEEDRVAEMSAMATEIVREHFNPIIGKAQNDYMIRRFQTVEAIRSQLEHGYEYYFVCKDGRRIGFLAFYPKESCLYLSKFYLYKSERGKGYAGKMMDFVIQKAREAGLSSVELNVNRGNEARRAYEKLGFTILRTEKNDIGEGYYMDDYVYGIVV